MIRKYLFTLWLIAYEQVVLDHEEKTQLILSLSMTSMDQVLETIVKNQNAIRIWVSDQINHVCDKIIPVAMHDQKNKTSPEAQVARWEDSLIKGEKCSPGNWDAIKELNYNGHWYRSLGCWVTRARNKIWAGRWCGPQYTQRQELQRGSIKGQCPFASRPLWSRSMAGIGKVLS